MPLVSVSQIKSLRGHAPVHEAGSDGQPICASGRRNTRGFETVSGPVTCTRCRSLREKQPKNEAHHMVIVRACSCGNTWPCAHAHDETMCKARTAKGDLCMTEAAPHHDGYCVRHWRMSL